MMRSEGGGVMDGYKLQTLINSISIIVLALCIVILDLRGRL